MTKNDTRELEIIDEILLRRILNAPAKTSLPALYLELGCYSVKYTIMKSKYGFAPPKFISGRSVALCKVVTQYLTFLSFGFKLYFPTSIVTNYEC